MKKVLGAVLVVIVAGSFFAYTQTEPSQPAKKSPVESKSATSSLAQSNATTNPTLSPSASSNTSLPVVTTPPTKPLTTTDGSEGAVAATPETTPGNSSAACDAPSKATAWATYNQSWKAENDKFQKLHSLTVPILDKDKDDHESILNELTYQLDTKLMEAHCL